ncbi:nicotinate-nucleotide adenylyltransferase [Uliginosibacterium aquaticum]|uniref:Probable nicotinate-nucleotide adenylyltransferase n=1 Tax=Uliginosibacterium aquaticum TaxID=2731212 RepID=A0ABX2IBL3_9RHOO|nr:nicotinate-nucleotide adenylyltransferase [Uliginosibacterium aquaticum]NSL53628.1 nicotinate-nucleotide adenylyltransferase [Uliginosibacterium aquaticum]
MSVSPPLGILGGTFDPIHYGHLRMAEEAREALGLARVRLIPAGRPPHREQPATPAEMRLAMTRLAVEDCPHLEVDPAEVLADAPSYTVPTLERLRAELGPDQPLVLLLGMDAFRSLASWHRWQDLFSLAHIGVATRPGYTLAEQTLGDSLATELQSRNAARPGLLAATPAGRIASFAMTPLAISATAIRATLTHHGSPRFLLPDAVLDYIQDHHLYQT